MTGAGRPRRRGVLAWGFILLFGGAGLAVIGLSLLGSARALGFVLRAEAAAGEVVRVDQIRTGGRGRGFDYVAVFRFHTPDGQEVTTASRNGNGWARYAAGEVVRLRYDPTDPQRAEADPWALLVLAPLLGVCFGALPLLLASAVLRATPAARFEPEVAAGRPFLGGRLTSTARGPLPGWPWLPLAGLAIYGLVSGIALVWLQGETAAAQARLRVTALATGEVVGHREATVSHGPGRTGTRYAAMVRFTPLGGAEQRITLAGTDTTRTPPIGAPVVLRYLSSDPATAAPDPGWRLWLPTMIAGAVAALLLLGGGGLLWRFGRRRA